MTQPEYFAPARFVLTVLHRRDPEATAGKHPATGEPVEGWTVCGSPMAAEELWQPVEYRQEDRLCPVCCYGAAGVVAAGAEEAGLW